MHIQLNGDIRPAIRGFPDSMPKRLVQKGGDHAAMHNAVDIAVLFFHQQPMQAPAIHGFVPEGAN